MFDLVEKMQPRPPIAPAVVDPRYGLAPDSRPHRKPEPKREWRCMLCERELPEEASTWAHAATPTRCSPWDTDIDGRVYSMGPEWVARHRRWLKYGAMFRAARSCARFILTCSEGHEAPCARCGFLIAWWLPARRFRLRGTVSLGERIVVVTFIP